MGLRGPVPKPSALRQRRNRESTRAVLPAENAVAETKIPKLPTLVGAKWHAMVVQWWESVWRSPMAAEYLTADREGLFLLARLHQDFWTAETRKERQSAAAEIRQQGQRFGLSPIDRRRLQWEVERADEAVEKAQKRRAPKADPNKDPRDVLKKVG